MFVISQTKNTSVNTQHILSFEVIIEANKPQVVAIMDNAKQLLMAVYSTVAECRIAVDYISFCINSNKSVIRMPPIEEIQMSIKKTLSVKGNTTDIKILVEKLFEGDEK